MTHLVTFMTLTLTLTLATPQKQVTAEATNCTYVSEGGKVISADCSHRGWTAVPSGLPSSLVTLDLSGNLLSSLADSDAGPFSQLRDLETLDLSGNRISRLGNLSFSGLPRLLWLSLRWNPLHMTPGTFPADVFKDLGQLAFLDLHLQPFPVSPDQDIALSRLRQLRTLRMNGLGNNVELGPGFSRLEELEVLDMNGDTGHCAMAALSERFFSSINTSRALTLNLTHCELRVIHNNTFSFLPTLHSLDLTNVRGLKFPRFVEASKSLWKTKIKVLNITGIYRGSKIKIKAEYFQYLGYTRIQHLEVCHVGAYEIELRAFFNLPTDMQYLSICQNNLIAGKSASGLYLLPHIQTVDMSVQNDFGARRRVSSRTEGRNSDRRHSAQAVYTADGERNKYGASEATAGQSLASGAGESPLRTEESPLRTEESPLRTEESPLRTEESPLRTEESPLRTEESLLRTEESPLRTEESPTRTEESPTLTEESPTLTEESPTRTKESPMTGESPVRTGETGESPLDTKDKGTPLYFTSVPVHGIQDPPRADLRPPNNQARDERRTQVQGTEQQAKEPQTATVQRTTHQAAKPTEHQTISQAQGYLSRVQTTKHQATKATDYQETEHQATKATDYQETEHQATKATEHLSYVTTTEHQPTKATVGLSGSDKAAGLNETRWQGPLRDSMICFDHTFLKREEARVREFIRGLNNFLLENNIRLDKMTQPAHTLRQRERSELKSSTAASGSALGSSAVTDEQTGGHSVASKSDTEDMRPFRKESRTTDLGARKSTTDDFSNVQNGEQSTSGNVSNVQNNKGTAKSTLRNVSSLTDDIVPLPPTLRFVNLSEMKLGYTLPRGQFLDNRLERFDLSKNNLPCFLGPWLGLHKLWYFDLSFNFAVYLSKEFFRDMPSLTHLFLQENFLGESFANDSQGLMLSGLKSLQVLNLDSNLIKSLSESAFSANENLTTLSLAHNAIAHFKPRLANMTALTFMDLSDNNINFLRQDNMKDFDTISELSNLTIDLYRNPLSCGCDSLDFWYWVVGDSKVRLHRLHQYNCTLSNGSEISYGVLERELGSVWLQCQGERVLTIAVAMLVTLLFLLSVLGVLHYKRWRLRYFYYVGLRRYHRPYRQHQLVNPRHVHGVRDVFVSFDDEDPRVRLFLQNVLLPQFDRRGMTYYVSEIDFPNWHIDDIIPEVVLGARKTLALFSSRFFPSSERELEFNMAVYHEEETHQRVIVPVLLERVDWSAFPPEVMVYLEERACIPYQHDSEQFMEMLMTCINTEVRL